MDFDLSISVRIGEAVTVARIDGKIDDQFQFKERNGVLFAAGELTYDDNDDDQNLRSEVHLRRIEASDFSVQPSGLAPLVSSTRRETMLAAMRFDDERLWMSFESPEDGRTELHVAPLDGTPGRSLALGFYAYRLQPVGDGMIAMNSWAPPAKARAMAMRGAGVFLKKLRTSILGNMENCRLRLIVNTSDFELGRAL